MLEILREKAEQLISADKNSNRGVQLMEVKRLFHELRVQQIELEMQNDELQNSYAELEHGRINFSNLFELAPISYFVTSQTGIIQNVNYAGIKLFDSGKNSMVGKLFLLNIHPEDRDEFYIYFKKLFASPDAQTCFIRLIKKNQDILNVQVDGIAVQNSDINPICYLTVTDFTAKQQAEQKLKEAKKTLEIALEASSTGIWEIDIVSGKIYFDDFCLALYGFDEGSFDGSYETMIGKVYQHDRKNVDHEIRQAIIREKELNIRFRVNCNNQGLRYVQSRAQVVTDQQQKKRFIGTFTDISDKMMMEMEASRIKEEQQQMILAAGLQAEEKEKKRISEVLHDGIAQMLYAVKLNIDQVKNTEEKPSYDHLMQLLNQSIRDIRNISFELAPSILTDFGLAATLEDMALRLSNSKLKVDTKVSHTCKSLPFETQLNIFRIVQELVNNSIKHAQASNISIEVTKKAKNTFITVADNGIGFDSNQTAEIPKGIGLSSIKNRLRLYKGLLTIESSPQTGTIVQISLKH
ncbi:MAG: PAS domain-containing protein [Mucilaginibacter sp.]|uniref:PAS domain-containing sensor histidine kinase n=1 Tax=Mucilaginibacter sp. TaxID=1882438 RepID=UPI0034E541C2